MAFQYFFVSTTLVDKPFTWKHGLGHELVGTHAKNFINKLKNAHSWFGFSHLNQCKFCHHLGRLKVIFYKVILVHHFLTYNENEWGWHLHWRKKFLWEWVNDDRMIISGSKWLNSFSFLSGFEFHATLVSKHRPTNHTYAWLTNHSSIIHHQFLFHNDKYACKHAQRKMSLVTYIQNIMPIKAKTLLHKYSWWF